MFFLENYIKGLVVLALSFIVAYLLRDSSTLNVVGALLIFVGAISVARTIRVE